MVARTPLRVVSRKHHEVLVSTESSSVGTDDSGTDSSGLIYRLGVDVGGTFTDFILADNVGKLAEAKVLSRPDSPGEALREGIEVLASELRATPRALLRRSELVIHGTTVATNALLQHRGARVALLCTEGFRDTLRMREGYKERRYDFSYQPPPSLVERRLCLPVRERISSDGSVLIPLDEEGLRRTLRVCKSNSVESIAICFLWSFKNPAHERRCAEIVKEECPEIYLTLSADLLPEIRFYDRTSTTVVNAFLGPVIQRYITNVEQMLTTLGYARSLRFTQCNGGVTSGTNLREKPVMALNSGPTAAPAAGRYFSEVAGTTDFITVDMGGTSFDVCIVKQGVPPTAKNVDVQRYRLGVPVVEVNAVGAGGGSIARVDAGLLRVGPESAEATPGPACYSLGGREPTVTDANLVLGYLNPESVLGGRLALDRDAALRAVDSKVADPLGMTTAEASYAIFRLVNDNMVRAIKEVSVEKGHDPRDFALMIGGGCGPVHAGCLAEELGIGRIVIPRVSSTFCAFGALVADIRYDYGRSYVRLVRDVDMGELRQMCSEMERAGHLALEADGIPSQSRFTSRFLEMRYTNQIHECSVYLEQGVLESSDLDHISTIFHDRHRVLYMYSEPDEDVELVNVRVAVVGKTPAPAVELPVRNGPKRTLVRDTRRVLFDQAGEFVDTPIFRGSDVEPGFVVVGPSVVEEAHTTIVVPRTYRLSYDVRGAYVMERDDS